MAKRARRQQERQRRPIITARKPLCPGEIVQFVDNPADNLPKGHWIFDPGIRMWSGKYKVEELAIAFSSKPVVPTGGREVESINRTDLYNCPALLIESKRMSFADLYKVLVEDRTWWVLRKDIKGKFHG